MGTQLYGYSRTEHEYQVLVPKTMSDDGWITIYLSAHGGGTIGKSYAGNGWDYAVYDGDSLVIEGSDIRSPEGRPAGHAETARSLCSFLSYYGEGFSYGDRSELDYADEYTEPGQEWLAANHERLAMFASEECSCLPGAVCGICGERGYTKRPSRLRRPYLARDCHARRHGRTTQGRQPVLASLMRGALRGAPIHAR